MTEEELTEEELFVRDQCRNIDLNETEERDGDDKK
jgi:hypothetical protein